MPFTFSHPAIILPLINKKRKIFSATGLIIGSIAPDFESFIRINEKKVYSHTWTGMFWFDLPLALIISFLFHLIVRQPLIENLPIALEEKFGQYKNFDWLAWFKKKFVIVIISLLIGIASHLLWDAFTHLNLRSPDDTASMIMVGRTRLYIILQYSCSLIGLFVIVIYIYKLPRTEVKNYSRVKFKFWLFTILLFLLCSAWLVTNIYNDADVSSYMRRDFILYIYVGISSLLIALIIVSIIYKYFLKKSVHLSDK